VRLLYILSFYVCGVKNKVRYLITYGVYQNIEFAM
jgi:hypothetical protein